MTAELRRVATAEEWEAYHAIRQRVLWEARGRAGTYDRSHPDEHKDGNFPFLLVTEGGESVGTIRIDIAPPVAWFRRVAISEERQRQGHGRQMLMLAAGFAKERGCQQLRSNVAADAVPFYRKLGFDVMEGEVGSSSVPMARWF
jgi:GNAT superfamily N-acetyltransferase